jgi:hypothetical protein
MRIFHSGLLAGERVNSLSYSTRLFLPWPGCAKPRRTSQQKAAK